METNNTDKYLTETDAHKAPDAHAHKTPRVQERLSLDQKRQVLERIHNLLGKTVVTRKELKENIQSIAVNPVANPWAQVRFFVNDPESSAVPGKKGVYDITKPKAYGFRPTKEAGNE